MASKYYTTICDKIADKLGELFNHITGARQYMDFDEYCLMFWTPEQMRQVREMSHLVNGAGPAGHGRVVAMDIDHPVAGKFSADVAVEMYRWDGAHHMPNPHGSLRGGPTVAKFQEIVQEGVRRAMDVGNFIRVFRQLRKKCDTLAQLRYHFPPLTYLLRYCGYEAEASKLEEVTKRPAGLQSLDPMTVKRTRHAIQWFAIQQLLGTFTEAPKLPYERNPAGSVRIGVSAGTFRVKTETGEHEAWRMEVSG